jgi:hypothetical protein
VVVEEVIDMDIEPSDAGDERRGELRLGFGTTDAIGWELAGTEQPMGTDDPQRDGVEPCWGTGGATG